MFLHELDFLLSSAYLTAHISPLPKCPQQGTVSNIVHRVVWIQSRPPSVSLTAAMRPEMKHMLINTAASRIYLKISITSNCNHSGFDVRTLSKQERTRGLKSRQLTGFSFHWGASNHTRVKENKLCESCFTFKKSHCRFLLFTFIHKTR